MSIPPHTPPRRTRLDASWTPPRRAVAWWSGIDALEWPQQHVRSAIQRRADAFAEAGIDLAINYGMHCRFDFADYFGTVHGYLADVAEALHARGITFWDHFTCSLIERPSNTTDWWGLHRENRHHVLLHPDAEARAHQQYAGQLFDPLRTVDIATGRPRYIRQYAAESFCHNNPDFRRMLRAYLQRLVAEVPLDGLEIDDMCDYGGLRSCGCPHCRRFFRERSGHDLPDWDDREFWADAADDLLTGGNYANPLFVDWVAFRFEGIADHLARIREAVGDLPLMTCCSATGPLLLNGAALDLEHLAPSLDALMLENCGVGPQTTDWVPADIEALTQKNIAHRMGDAPALALSYSIFADGAELGWALARFWGVTNWASTHHGRLSTTQERPLDVLDVLGPLHRWEDTQSPLSVDGSQDLCDVELLNSVTCRYRGWRDAAGLTHFDHVAAASQALVRRHLTYRVTGDVDVAHGSASALPLLVPSAGAVTRELHSALLEQAGAGRPLVLLGEYATLSGPGLVSGVRDELLALPSVTTTDSSAAADATLALDRAPLVRCDSEQWALRPRRHREGTAIHLLSTVLSGVPHPTLLERGRNPVLERIIAGQTDMNLVVDAAAELVVDWAGAELVSPDLEAARPVAMTPRGDRVRLTCDLAGVRLYAVVQAAGLGRGALDPS